MQISPRYSKSTSMLSIYYRFRFSRSVSAACYTAPMRRILTLIALAVTALTLSAADISGTWSAAVTLDAGSGTATFMFKQTGDTFSGTYSGALGEAKVTGTVKGNQVEWSF